MSKRKLLLGLACLAVVFALVARLNGMINVKFAGLGQLYQTLDQFFRKLADPAPIAIPFRIPDNYLYQGIRAFRWTFLPS